MSLVIWVLIMHHRNPILQYRDNLVGQLTASSHLGSSEKQKVVLHPFRAKRCTNLEFKESTVVIMHSKMNFGDKQTNKQQNQQKKMHLLYPLLSSRLQKQTNKQKQKFTCILCHLCAHLFKQILLLRRRLKLLIMKHLIFSLTFFLIMP